MPLPTVAEEKARKKSVKIHVNDHKEKKKEQKLHVFEIKKDYNPS